MLLLNEKDVDMRTIAAVLDKGKDKHVAQSLTPSASCQQGPFSRLTGQDYPMAKRDTQALARVYSG